MEDFGLAKHCGAVTSPNMKLVVALCVCPASAHRGGARGGPVRKRGPARSSIDSPELILAGTAQER